MSPIRAALYARVSSDQQALAQTIESQLTTLRTRIEADGAWLDPEHEFIDDGYSGSTLIRPELERLRDLVASGGVDRLYVHSPDRLARKYAYQVLLVDEWQRAGLEIVFLNHALGESPEDELLLQVQGMIAEYERAKILERSRRGKRHKAQIGSVSVVVSHANPRSRCRFFSYRTRQLFPDYLAWIVGRAQAIGGGVLPTVSRVAVAHRPVRPVGVEARLGERR